MAKTAIAIATIVARIGDWSYSLYLVHWPLFSFAYIAYLGSPARVVSISTSSCGFVSR